MVNPRNTRKSFDLDIFQRYLALRAWGDMCRANNDRKGYTAATRYADSLRNRLFIENQSLLRKLGAKYARKCKVILDEEDTYQVAYLAFTEYLDKYDYTRGLFSTYIDAWIRHEMQQAGRRADTAPTQPRIFRMPQPLRKLDEKSMTTNGRRATLEEMQVEGCQQTPPIDVTAEDVARWRTSEIRVSSLDESIGAGSSSGPDGLSTLHDVLADTDAADAERLMVSSALTDDLAGAILALAPIERRAVLEHFVEGRAKEDVARTMGMGPRELDVLLGAAMAKLRIAVES